MDQLATQLISPPREFSLVPFWFWNDDLSEPEILRQIADFDAHGVYGFVIHPRVGLPRSIGFMSDAMLRFAAVAVREAKRRDMRVMLYDEGMYPSGSACGQVVAENPDLACRCLAIQELKQGEQPKAEGDQKVVAVRETASGKRVAVIDRKANSYIRGLHYIGEGPKEDEPPAGDILNPETTRAVLRLVYERYHRALGEHFGSTVIGLFTDEPHPLGKSREKHVRPGSAAVLEHVSRTLGYDFVPHLPALWYDDEPDAKRYRADYDRAIRRRLDESWYRPLSDWCASRNVALCGHPAQGDDYAVQRFFTFPGQDVVWRFIEPDKPSALEGAESTQGKVTSSAMVHLGRRRNSNEFCGAFGHQTTFEEMKWLADWLLVRGINLLIPHAFYYSIRGPRKDERPPQLGPHTPAWEDGRFTAFAEHCRRLSWLNTDAQHVCDVAILTDGDHAAWPAAKVCFQHQRDFNYIDAETVLAAEVAHDGLRVGPHARYQLVILDGVGTLPPAAVERLRPMIDAGHVVAFGDAPRITGVPVAASPQDLVAIIDRTCAPDVRLAPASPGLRFRHVVKGGQHFYILFNETRQPIAGTLTVAATGQRRWVDTVAGRSAEAAAGDLQLNLGPYGVALLHVAT